MNKIFNSHGGDALRCLFHELWVLKATDARERSPMPASHSRSICIHSTVPGFTAKGVFQLDGYIRDSTVTRLHEIFNGFGESRNQCQPKHGCSNSKINRRYQAPFDPNKQRAPQGKALTPDKFMDFLQNLHVTYHGSYTVIFEGSRERTERR